MMEGSGRTRDRGDRGDRDRGDRDRLQLLPEPQAEETQEEELLQLPSS